MTSLDLGFKLPSGYLCWNILQGPQNQRPRVDDTHTEFLLPVNGITRDQSHKPPNHPDLLTPPLPLTSRWCPRPLHSINLTFLHHPLHPLGTVHPSLLQVLIISVFLQYYYCSTHSSSCVCASHPY